MAMMDWDVSLLCVCFLLGRFALYVCFLLGGFVGGRDGLRKRETEERETGREREREEE